MKQLMPRIETVKAIFLIKGWEWVETTKGFFVFKPPAEFDSPDFRLYLTRWEDGPHYTQITTEILEEYAEVLGWKASELIYICSKTPKELDQYLLKAIRHEQKKEEAKLALAS